MVGIYISWVGVMVVYVYVSYVGINVGIRVMDICVSCVGIRVLCWYNIYGYFHIVYL